MEIVFCTIPTVTYELIPVFDDQRAQQLTGNFVK